MFARKMRSFFVMFLFFNVKQIPNQQSLAGFYADGWEYPIRNTEMVYSKGPTGERDSMNSWCLQLQRLLRLRRFSGPQDPLTYEPCTLCSVTAKMGFAEHAARLSRVSDLNLHGCTECTAPWHIECCGIVVADYAFDERVPFRCPVCLDPDH